MQLTEILIYCQHYKIFPSDDLDDIDRTPLLTQFGRSLSILEEDIALLNIYMDIVDNHSDWKNKVFKNRSYKEPSLQELKARFGNQSKKQRA